MTKEEKYIALNLNVNAFVRPVANIIKLLKVQFAAYLPMVLTEIMQIAT